MLQACNMISLFGTMLLQLIHHNAHAFFTSVASAMSSFLSAGIHFLKTWLAHSANFCLWSNGKHRCELRGQFQAWTGRTWWGSHLRRIVRPGTRSEALWPASKAIEIKQTGRRCLLHRSPLRDMDGIEASSNSLLTSCRTSQSRATSRSMLTS